MKAIPLNFLSKLRFESIIYILMIIVPTVIITIPKAASTLVTILSILCLASLKHSSQNWKSTKTMAKIFAMLFLAHFISIALTQMYWGNFELSGFQQQGRLILFIPIFLYIYLNAINLNTPSLHSIPITSILSTIAGIFIFPAPASQWIGRPTIQHIDPLSFGYIMLFFACASLLIATSWARNWKIRVLCILGFLCGIYMSIRTGTRSGWIGVPIIGLFFAISSGKLNWYNGLGLLCILFLISLGLYTFVDIVYQRINIGFMDISNYVWHGHPDLNETSIGMRISMLRTGWHCFLESPLFGFGEQNLYYLIDNSIIKDYSGPVALQKASTGFMHNEMMTQMVKYGLIGALVYLSFIFSVIYLFILRRKFGIKTIIGDAFFIYFVLLFSASLSTEVLILKPMILFFGIMFASFAGESLWKIEQVKAEL
jgi:O-antigen ligase